MLAVRGHYRQGMVVLDAPIPDIEEAEVMVVISTESRNYLEPKLEGNVADNLTEETWGNMDAFEAASLVSFFASNDDENINWMEVFDVARR